MGDVVERAARGGSDERVDVRSELDERIGDVRAQSRRSVTSAVRPASCPHGGALRDSSLEKLSRLPTVTFLLAASGCSVSRTSLNGD